MKELRKIIQDINEHFNKEIEMLKKNQIETLEIKSSINQIKDLAEGFNNGLDQAGKTILELEGNCKILYSDSRKGARKD